MWPEYAERGHLREGWRKQSCLHDLFSAHGKSDFSGTAVLYLLPLTFSAAISSRCTNGISLCTVSILPSEYRLQTAVVTKSDPNTTLLYLQGLGLRVY